MRAPRKLAPSCGPRRRLPIPILQCETDQLRTKLHQAVSDLGRSHYEIQAAVSKERDRCQRIVEQFAKSGDYRVMANLIIAAIIQGPP